jgi:uncharacterized membrane protein (DUF485 family)
VCNEAPFKLPAPSTTLAAALTLTALATAVVLVVLAAFASALVAAATLVPILAATLVLTLALTGRLLILVVVVAHDVFSSCCLRTFVGRDRRLRQAGQPGTESVSERS